MEDYGYILSEKCSQQQIFPRMTRFFFFPNSWDYWDIKKIPKHKFTIHKAKSRHTFVMLFGMYFGTMNWIQVKIFRISQPNYNMCQRFECYQKSIKLPKTVYKNVERIVINE